MEIERAISKIIEKVTALEGENAPIIIDYLTLDRRDDLDVIDLADCNWRLQLLCNSAKHNLRLPPSGFSPPFSSQSSPRILENRFVMSARATPLISGSVSGSHSNLRSSWSSSSSSSSSSSGVDGGFGLTPRAFRPPFSSQPLPRNWGNRFFESAAGTSSLISGSVSGSHSNLRSSWSSSSSSSSGVDGVLGLTPSGSISGNRFNLSSWPFSSSSSYSSVVSGSGDFSLWENKDPFRVYAKNGDANLQKSSLGFDKLGSDTKSVQRQEKQIKRGNVSSCTKSLQKLQIVKEAEKKIETIFSKDDFPVLKGNKVLVREKQLKRFHIQNLNKGQQTAPPPETAPAAPEAENAAPEAQNAAPGNLPGSSKNSDETHQEESEKEKSTPVDDSSENKEETSGMSESARQETTAPLDTAAPGNSPGSSKNLDETHKKESEKKKSTTVDDSRETKEETSGMSESARQETAVPPETAAPGNLPGSPKNLDETHKKESEKKKSTSVDDSGETKEETSVKVVKKSM